MSSRLVEIFTDEKLIQKVNRRLPYLFQLAESESSRAGKTGMEVGSARERIVVALLMYKFGEAIVETEVSITEPEADARLFGKPVLVKTITGKGGVKRVWTVDGHSESCHKMRYGIKVWLPREIIEESGAITAERF